MGDIYCIASQKGGNAKTTTALAMAAGFASKGKKTLLIDLDPQGNATFATGARSDGPTSRDLLTGKTKAKDAVQQTHTGALIAASPWLAGADMDFNGKGADKLLQRALEPIRGQYDYIIIDTPPALGILTINALTAADKLIITAQADVFSLQGIDGLAKTIEPIKERTNPRLEISGILLTRYNARSILTRDVTKLAEQLAKRIGTTLFNTKIREGIAVKESQISQQSLFSYAQKSNPALDYMDFISELERKE